MLLAILAVLLGMVGNAVMNPPYLVVFLEYFLPAMLIIAVMLNRVALLKGMLFTVCSLLRGVSHPLRGVAKWIERKIAQINAQQVVFFTRGDNLANLNRAVLYVRRNEHTNRLEIVTVYGDLAQVPDRLRHDVAFLNEAYPNVSIEFVQLQGEFGPELIRTLSRQWDIPTNFMFIGSPGDGFMYGLADLGGVRLII